jgi:hypothetical protein
MLHQLTRALSPAALLTSVLALAVAGAGVGYTAATIGTNDLANNAVTSPKIKNGTVRAADMVAEKKFTYIDAPGPPSFSDGGQGDCVWQSAEAVIPGLPRAGFRTDRFGTVHLSGLVQRADGAGGDAVCDSAQVDDGIMFKLPASARPKKHVVRVIASGATPGTLIIANKNGLVSGPTTLPPGSVYWTGDSVVLLDGISFPAANTKVFGRTATSGKVTPQGRAMLKKLGIG